MASVTLKMILNETAREDDAHLVLLRITYQRKHKYVGTGVYVRQKHFNPDGTYDKQNWVRKSYGEASAVEIQNGVLKAWIDRVNLIKLELTRSDRPFSSADIKARLESRSDQSFSDYVEQKIAIYRLHHQTSCAKCSRSVLVNLREFMRVDKKTGIVQFSDLNRDAMQRFETFLVTKPRKRLTSDAKRRNTASGYLARLHQHLREYVIDNDLPDAADPLRGRTFTYVTTEVVRLNEAEIDHALVTSIPNPKNLRSVTRLEHVRKLYVCSYGIQGIRVGDLVSARVRQLQKVFEMVDGKATQRWRFFYESQKRNLAKSVLIEGPVLDILGDYCQGKQDDQFIFPFLKDKYRHCTDIELEEPIRSQVGDANRLLKKVAAELGINKYLTLHSARHSFAEHLMDMTEDLKAVQNSLGHTDIATTQRYVSRMKQTRVDKANAVYSRWKSEPQADGPPAADESGDSPNKSATG